MNNKRASIKNRSPLDAFLKDDEETKGTSTDQRVNKSTSQQTGNLERTGFYVRSDQDKAIDRLLLDLKDQEIKANRSTIVRAALDLLLGQDLSEITALVREQKD